jgi:hypothetical protein
MKSRILAALAAGCVVVFAWGSAGCQSRSSSAAASISGKVLYKGQPLTGGDIAFHPKAAGGIPYSCPINADGSFSGTLPTGTLGDVIVTVQTMPAATPASSGQSRGAAKVKMAAEMREKMLKEYAGKIKKDQEHKTTPPAQPVPQKYTQKTTSPLTWTITEGSNTKDFDLTD